MKRLIILIIIILSISCERLFNEADDSIGIIDNDQELIESITGIYGLLQEVYYYYDYHLTCIKADDINLDPTVRNIGGSSCSFSIAGNWDTSLINKTVYRNLYNTIISANNLITQYENGSNNFLLNGNSSIIKSCLGEAYFIRSISYFYLTRLFGKIPVIRDIDVKFDIKRSPIPDIYNSIVDDMIESMKYLPDSYINARIPYVTPHRGCAKAVLAEIYLTMAGYPLKDTVKYELV